MKKLTTYYQCLWGKVKSRRFSEMPAYGWYISEQMAIYHRLEALAERIESDKDEIAELRFKLKERRQKKGKK